MIHFGVYIDTLSSYIFLEGFILYKNDAVIAHIGYGKYSGESRGGARGPGPPPPRNA